MQPTGVEKAPNVFLDEGFLTDNEVVEVSNLNETYAKVRSESGILNEESMQEFSLRLLEAVLAVKKQESFPIVLGGDCSILLGIMPAMKLYHGQAGLITFDGHADFYYPHESTTGEAADMDIALVSGHGPNSLVNIQRQEPYVKEENIIHVGQRDREETLEYGSHQIEETNIQCISFEKIRDRGVDKTAYEIENLLSDDSEKEYWLHFDTDVIKDEENPAVDYRLEDGLSFEECKKLLNSALRSEKIAGISIGIYNPELDKERVVSKKIIEMFEEVLVGE